MNPKSATTEENGTAEENRRQMKVQIGVSDCVKSKLCFSSLEFCMCLHFVLIVLSV